VSAPASAPERPRRGGSLRDAARNWSVHDDARRAAALSYYTAFSAAPLVLILIAALGALFGDQAAEGLLFDRLSATLGPDKAGALEDLIATAPRPKAGLAGVIGVSTLLWGASNVVGELQSSLNAIFQVNEPRRGLLPFLRRRLIAVAFVLSLGFLLLVSLGLGALAAAAGRFFGERLAALGLRESVLHAFNAAAAFGVLTALFAAMFRFLPDARISWRDLLPGAALTALLFTAGDYALGLYLGRTGAGSAYGAAGALMAFLLWTYYSAQIVYFGAEFARARARASGRSVRQRYPPPEELPR
jgi:membrane protein